MSETVLGLSAPVAKIVLPFIADSIRFAHKRGPAKWGLTPLARGVRFNAGFCEAMTFLDDGGGLLVQTKLAPRRGALRGTGAYSQPYGDRVYRSAPGSSHVDLSYRFLAELRGALKALRPAHEAILDVILRRKFHRGSRQGHSNDAVLLLERAVGTRLPRPTYATDVLSETRWEGALERTMTVRYERDRQARKDCILHHGSACAACGLLFEQRYGFNAKGLIHVHHPTPLAVARGKRRPVEGRRDLVPVCPNCHAVIHSREEPYSIREVKAMIAQCPRSSYAAYVACPCDQLRVEKVATVCWVFALVARTAQALVLIIAPHDDPASGAAERHAVTMAVPGNGGYRNRRWVTPVSRNPVVAMGVLGLATGTSSCSVNGTPGFTSDNCLSL